jgi:hypothetical protein
MQIMSHVLQCSTYYEILVTTKILVSKDHLMYLIKHRKQVLVDIIQKLAVRSPSLQKHTSENFQDQIRQRILLVKIKETQETRAFV